MLGSHSAEGHSCASSPRLLTAIPAQKWLGHYRIHWLRGEMVNGTGANWIPRNPAELDQKELKLSNEVPPSLDRFRRKLPDHHLAGMILKRLNNKTWIWGGSGGRLGIPSWLRYFMLLPSEAD